MAAVMTNVTVTPLGGSSNNCIVQDIHYSILIAVFGLVLLLSVSRHLHILCTSSLQLSFALPILQCPFTSIFHVLITTSSSVFLSVCHNHLSLASLMFSLMFATPDLVLIPSVLIYSVTTQQQINKIKKQTLGCIIHGHL